MIRLNRFFGKKDAGDLGSHADPMAGPAGSEDPGFADQLRRAVATANAFIPIARPSDGSVVPDTPGDDGLSDAALSEQALIQGYSHRSDPALSSQTVAGAAIPGAIVRPTHDMVAHAQRQLAAALPAHRGPDPMSEPDVPIDLSGLDLPDMGRTARRGGRVKTRLLGFDAAPTLTQDPIVAARENVAVTPNRFPAGWIVVTKGPGRGAFFPVYNGVSQIGRGEDQAIRLDFGDSSISRSNHAAIAYDDELNAFFLGHGGKTNIMRLNDRPVVSTERLNHLDLIRIGETTLMFVALCNASFRWTDGLDGPGHLD
jgi:hypothetical protein